MLNTGNNVPTAIDHKMVAEVAAIWKEVLGLPDIDPQKRFFDQGGNSINAITLMGRMKNAGYRVTLRDIIHHQTVLQIVQEVLQPAVIRQVETPAGLEAYVHQKSGITVNHRTMLLQDSDGVSKYNILFTEPEKSAIVLQLITESVQQITPAILPHYVTDREIFDETEGTLMTVSELYSRLGLQPLQSFDIAAARDLIKETFHANDDAIRKTIVSGQYPLCAMQQLQISFRTRACVDVIPFHTYVNLAVLQQVYSILIERHCQLRSIAVKDGDFYTWEKHAYHASVTPSIPVIDLTGYQCPPADFHELLSQFTLHLYDPGKIFHQFILFRRNLKEYYLVMIFSHVIFDRVTGEIVKSQVVNYYQDLMDKGTVREEKIPSFETYVKMIGKGPQQTTEQEVIQTFQLEAFYNAKQRLREKLYGMESHLSYSFIIRVSLQDSVQQQNMLETTLAIYSRALSRYLETEQIPLLFVCDGRQYEDNLYYNTIGEFTDMVPMLIDARWSLGEIGKTVSRRLADLKQYNLNFMHQLLHPDAKGNWPEIGKLMDAGEQFERFDMLMFNFLGNADEITVEAEEAIDIQPNPLPIYSLLNCIASAVAGRITFILRSSYTIDIDKLRKLFKEASIEVHR